MPQSQNSSNKVRFVVNKKYPHRKLIYSKHHCCCNNHKYIHMIVTHLAADGKSMPLHVENSSSSMDDAPACELVHPSELADDDLSLTDGNPPCLRKTTKYVLFAMAVFLGQIAVSVTLKRYGLIEKDFNEIVAERVVPHLQSGFEQTGFRMPQFNESLYWIQSFNQSLPSINSVTQTRIRPGFQLAQKGAKVTYPVVMVPGFVTSALEVWQGKECAKQLFRQRVWGGVSMVQHFLMDRHCIMEHIALDPMTGKDPDNIRVRAVSGFEAADYFAGNYWVWSKILENLADIGYDGNMMSMESYDWRLSFPMLEERDRYLTKLKNRIETFHKISGQKVVLTSHSLGCVLVHYFFAWVTTSKKKGGGGGGRDWVDKHIHAYINIAGAQLGAPKSASSLLSGEMSDTVVLGAAGTLIEQFLGRRVRKNLWTTWGSLWSMLPKGGDAIWNVGADTQPRDTGDDHVELRDDFGEHLIVFTDPSDKEQEQLDAYFGPGNDDFTQLSNVSDPAVVEAIKSFSSRTRHTSNEVTQFLRQWGGGWGPNISSARWHSFDPKENPSRATWHDLSRTPLPHAPNMKVFCLYGVGLDTERAYYYKRNMDENSADSRAGVPADPPFILDTSVEDPANKVVHGVKYADGDGSVPLLSLGYLCADGWRRKENGLNPSGAKVVTREYKHKQELVFEDPMRGGPYSSDHVDIMGNLDMLEDFLKVVSDIETDTVQDHIVSDIEEIAARIARHPNGGLKKGKRHWIF